MHTNEIDYIERHPYIDVYNDYNAKRRFNSSDGFKNLAEMASALLDAALTKKHISWAYEEEVRIISENSGVHSFQSDALDYIVLGMNTPFQDEVIVKKLLCQDKWKHVSLLRAKQCRADLGIEVISA